MSDPKPLALYRSGLLVGALLGVLCSCAPPSSQHAVTAPPSALPASATNPSPPSLEEIATAEKNSRQNASDIPSRLKLADLYLRAGKEPEAAHELRAIVRIRPDTVEAHRRLATLYHNAGYLDREYEALRSVAKLAPADWQSALRLADIATDQGWYDISEPMLAQAARSAPQEPRVLIAQASLAFVQHRYAQTEAQAREGLKNTPENTTFWVILSESCRMQKRLPEAEQALRSAIAHSSDTQSLTRNYARLAHLLLEPGWNPVRAADAEQAALEALAKSSDDLEARYWLARAQDLQGRANEAESNYMLAAKQDIQFEQIAYFLGRIYLRSSDPKKKQEGQRLLQLDKVAAANLNEYGRAELYRQQKPKDPTTHFNMAQWYAKAGRSSQAILELRRTLEFDPHNASARHLLGQILRAVGRISEAKPYES